MLIGVVGANRCVDAVKSKLYRDQDLLRHDGLKIKITEEEKGETTFFLYHINENSLKNQEGMRDRFCANLSLTLTELVLQELEADLVARFVKQYYGEVAAGEERIIEIMAKEHLLAHDYGQRQKDIYSAIVDYLSSNHLMNLEGFIRFRLKWYVETVEEAVDLAATTYIIEREYDIAVELLRLTLNEQEPGADLFHVLVEANGDVKVLDSDELIDDSVDESMIEIDICESEPNVAEVLVCTLVSLAPEKIILHSQSETNFVVMLKDVFEDRLVLCPGCHLCNTGAKGMGR